MARLTARSSRGGGKHPGFEAAASSAARKAGVSEERGRAMIAAGAMKASPSAVKRNPRLKRVPAVAKKAKAKGY
jgi:hypothetical protein